MENTQAQTPAAVTLPQTPTSVETPVVDTPIAPEVVAAPPKKFKVPKVPKIPKKIIILAVAVVVGLLVIATAGSVITNRKGGMANPTPSLTPTPTGTPVVELPSQYADDPDVAELKQNMIKLDQDLDAAMFRDDTLRSPTLDWAVKFD